MSEPGEAWDVAVVGGGPAGAVVARLLAAGTPHPPSSSPLPSQGRGAGGVRFFDPSPQPPPPQGEGEKTPAAPKLRVLLLDQAKFPRRKVCGCCLNRHTLSALAAAGLGDLPATLGAVPLHFTLLAAGGRTAAVRLPGGVSVSREAFDAALVDAARAAGVTVRTGVRVKMEEAAGGVLSVVRTRRVREPEPHTACADHTPEAIRAHIVIDATGLNGRLTAADVDVRPGSRIGAGTVLATAHAFYRPGTIYMATGRGGYVGLVRLEDGRLDVAAAFDAGFVRDAGSLPTAAERTMHEAGLPPLPELHTADWKGTPPLTRRPVRVAGPGWFAVGDAAGYVEPFTGEGMAWAIAGAVALAPIAARAVERWEDSLAAEWAAVHRTIVGRRQAVCRLTARVLRSPLACRMLVRGLRVLPGLANPFVRALNRPTTGFVAPAARR